MAADAASMTRKRAPDPDCSATFHRNRLAVIIPPGFEHEKSRLERRSGRIGSGGVLACVMPHRWGRTAYGTSTLLCGAASVANIAARHKRDNDATRENLSARDGRLGRGFLQVHRKVLDLAFPFCRWTIA
jgi:hypothetical protein